MKKQKANATTWQKFLEVGKWFIDFSSLSGISQYRISDNKISKTFWILSYWLGLAFTIMLVNQSFQRYLTNPYVTKVERKNAFSSPFPSVTICNPNRVHCKHLYDTIKACQKVWVVLNLRRLHNITLLALHFKLSYNFAEQDFLCRFW